MTEESDPVQSIKYSDDFGTVAMDGVILRLESEMSRLLFYQEKLRFTSKDEIDSKTEKLVKFEVRLPSSAIMGLGKDIVWLMNLVARADEIVKSSKNNDITVRAIEVKHEIQRRGFDSNDSIITGSHLGIEKRLENIIQDSKTEEDARDDN